MSDEELCTSKDTGVLGECMLGLAELGIYVLLAVNVVLGIRIALISRNAGRVDGTKHLLYSTTGVGFITIGVLSGASMNSAVGSDVTTLQAGVLGVASVGFAAIYLSLR